MKMMKKDMLRMLKTKYVYTMAGGKGLLLTKKEARNAAKRYMSMKKKMMKRY